MSIPFLGTFALMILESLRSLQRGRDESLPKSCDPMTKAEANSRDFERVPLGKNRAMRGYDSQNLTIFCDSYSLNNKLARFLTRE